MKAGDARSGPPWRCSKSRLMSSASGTELRDVKTLRTRAHRKRRRKAGAAVPWRVARGSWRHEDRDEEQLVEDSRWCQYRGLASKRSILEHETETRSQPTTAARQTEKLVEISLPFGAAWLEQSECVCDYSSRGTQFAREPYQRDVTDMIMI